MAAKKDTAHAKLVGAKAAPKTQQENQYEEYQRQLELAIENH